MEKFDSVIMITPYIGEYHLNNVFLRSLNADEINFLNQDMILEIREKGKTYSECMKNLQDKMKKIKSILQEE
jgi:hypothetical protein